MTLTQVWGSLLILMAAPCFGAFSPRPKGDRPGSSRWIPLLLGSLPGIAVIVLSRFFFPIASPWELLGLLALVMGRYWRYKETAALAVIAGLLLHDWQITLLVGFIGFVGLSFFRQVRWGTWEIIVLVSLALIMRHGGQDGYFVAAIALSGTLAWISGTAPESYEVWSFFKPESQFRSLDKLQTSDQVGEQAARLSQLN